MELSIEKLINDRISCVIGRTAKLSSLDELQAEKVKLNEKFIGTNSLNASLKEHSLKIKADLDCVFYIDGDEKAKLKAGMIQKIPLIRGEYELRFVSVENSADIVEVDFFEMPDHDKIYNVHLREQRNARLKIEEDTKKAELQRRMEEIRKAEERRIAEARRLDEEKKRQEIEARRRADEEKRKAEEAKNAELYRRLEERKAEAKRKEEEKNMREEERRFAKELRKSAYSIGERIVLGVLGSVCAILACIILIATNFTGGDWAEDILIPFELVSIVFCAFLFRALFTGNIGEMFYDSFFKWFLCMLLSFVITFFSLVGIINLLLEEFDVGVFIICVLFLFLSVFLIWKIFF